AVLYIKDQSAEPLLLKVGVSCVDYEGARLNLKEELENASFDQTVANAKNKWSNYLSVINVEDNDKDALKNFYTALYHTGIAPNVFSDADGRYRGMNDSILTTPLEDPVYTVFSLWDTFRAYHPLMTIIRPSQNEAYIRSLIKKAQEGGVFPMWEIAANYTGTMIGYHAVSLIADSYMKGYRDFDVQEAYKQSLKIAAYDTANIHAHPLVVAELMPRAKYYKNTLGYVPYDKDKESVAKALEYAYNDWCISLLAEELGDEENKEKYQRFAQGYKWYFDESTGFMRGLDSEGNWRVPFNPRASSHRNDDYCEGTAWQWSWFVPHDVNGLVALMGGKEKFITKLDSLFTVESALEGESTSMDISGLIGQYAHGNEPSHHIAHLYNYVGKPHRTQELLDSIIYSQYAPTPEGICGNEDCGQMSAWYIMNAMGLYQVAPGNPIYSIGRPIFDKMTINMEGNPLTIQTIHNSRKNKYVKSVSFNGVELTEPFITHDQLKQGGQLTFVMTDQPNE
ncbi:MAG: GH92 family glycosyl hydrolase, partial [Bacteroidales bacterium]